MHRSCLGCIIRLDKKAKSLCAAKNLLLFGPSSDGKSAFTLNAESPIKCFSCARWLSLPVAALFFLSAQFVNADPVGDFFKKVGQSISKAFQPQPAPNQTKKKPTTRVSRQPTPPKPSLVAASPTPLEQPTNFVKEEKLPPPTTVRRASAVPAEKAKGDLPYGIPVPGHKGMVTSPYSPEGNYIDVSAFAPGSGVRDPYTGKIFLVP